MKRRMWMVAVLVSLMAAGARADRITFSGTFGGLFPGSAPAAITGPLVGGTFSGSIDPAPIPVFQGSFSPSPDYSLTLSDASGGVVYSSSGATGVIGTGSPVAGVSISTAPSGAKATSLYVDLPLGGGEALSFVLSFDPSGGVGSTASLLGAPFNTSLAEQVGATVSSLSIAAVTTDLPVAQVPRPPATPEPASLALLGLGGVAAAAWRRQATSRQSTPHPAPAPPSSRTGPAT